MLVNKYCYTVSNKKTHLAVFANMLVNKYCYTVSNKKTHLADFETYVFRIFLRNHLSCKTFLDIYLHPCLKSFQMKKKEFFKSCRKISRYLQKRCFVRKSKLLEKIRHFEKLRNFFHGCKV